jgi:hypothetical protein
VLRFTRAGRYVPFDVACSGEEGTHIVGDRISVRCVTCGKPVVLPLTMRLDDIVAALESGKRFRHGECAHKKRDAQAVTGSGIRRASLSATETA